MIILLRKGAKAIEDEEGKEEKVQSIENYLLILILQQHQTAEK